MKIGLESENDLKENVDIFGVNNQNRTVPQARAVSLQVSGEVCGDGLWLVQSRGRRGPGTEPR